jgi:SAM-dependent methyltransferase
MTDARGCRLCGGADLRGIYRVDQVPVHSCLMLDTRAEALSFPCGDVDLAFCEACGFIQNRRYDPSLQAYSPAYEETQFFSPRFRRFLAELCDDQASRHALAGKTVLEIGCGKGEFLAALCERAGCSGIGIDPGYRPERLDSPAAARLCFIRDFYGPAYADLKADYVCCRHTLEHIGDVADFMRLIRQPIGDRTDVVVFFELPDTERVLTEAAFWDIYYEHCSYFTPGSLARLFRRTGFEPRRLWKAYDDQYLLLEALPTVLGTGPRLPEEDDLERTRRQVDGFVAAVKARTAELKDQLARWRTAGKSVALWGSGSKAVSYLTTLGVTDEVEAVVDINPHKHGKFLAGTGHEIVAPEALRRLRPDCVVIMNGIYTDEIRADLARLGLRPELTALA